MSPPSTPTIEAIIADVRSELAPQFEARLRQRLEGRAHEWLVDQVVRLALGPATVEQRDREAARDTEARARAARLERIRRIGLDAAGLRRFVGDHAATTREALMVAGALGIGAPPKGPLPLTSEHRSPAGEELLTEAKDLLYALLVGDEASGTHLDRQHQELLVVTLPRSKAGAFGFLGPALDDDRADTVRLEVQFGATVGAEISRGIATALSLINDLEVNEPVLHARMIEVEQRPLVP